MTGCASDRPVRRALVLVLAAALAALGPAGAGAPPVARAADGPEPVLGPLAVSNTALLARAAHGAARRLVAGLPVAPGSRVGLRPEGDDKLNADMREALLQALNERRITCVLLPPLAGDGDTSTADADAAAGTDSGPARTGPGGSKDLADLSRQAQQAQEAQREFDELQAERREQAARADSIARGGKAPATGSVLATEGSLPVLTWRVQEARVDYVRLFRGGLFGAQRVERRARADLALRLAPAGSDAISWSASADSTVGDVVLRSELAALEDRTRPETRPALPSQSFKKVLEPALVVVLIAGLVSLFYQNRP